MEGLPHVAAIRTATARRHATSRFDAQLARQIEHHNRVFQMSLLQSASTPAAASHLFLCCIRSPKEPTAKLRI